MKGNYDSNLALIYVQSCWEAEQHCRALAFTSGQPTKNDYVVKFMGSSLLQIPKLLSKKNWKTQFFLHSSPMKFSNPAVIVKMLFCGKRNLSQIYIFLAVAVKDFWMNCKLLWDPPFKRPVIHFYYKDKTSCCDVHSMLVQSDFLPLLLFLLKGPPVCYGLITKWRQAESG